MRRRWTAIPYGDGNQWVVELEDGSFAYRVNGSRIMSGCPFDVVIEADKHAEP